MPELTDAQIRAAVEKAMPAARNRLVLIRPLLDGRPWVCTEEEEQDALDELIRGFELFTPRWVGAMPRA